MQAIKPSKKKMRRKGNQPLDVFFSPKTVAVVGATENANTVGRTVLWNLARFTGQSGRSRLTLFWRPSSRYPVDRPY